jgi:hypothetical protein
MTIPEGYAGNAAVIDLTGQETQVTPIDEIAEPAGLPA